MARKINSIQDEILNIDNKENITEKQVEKQVNKIVKPTNVIQADLIREEKINTFEREKAQKNPNFKAFIPNRKVLKEKQAITIYVKKNNIAKLKRVAKNKDYSLGAIIDFLIDGIEE